MRRQGYRVFVIGALLAGCGEDAPAAPEPLAPPVHARATESSTVTPLSSATAEILANRQAHLRAETAGRVVSVSVEPGQRVEEGEVLLRLDVGRTESSVQAAQASVAQSRARLQQAKRELERTKTLVKVVGWD